MERTGLLPSGARVKLVQQGGELGETRGAPRESSRVQGEGTFRGEIKACNHHC